MKKPNTVNIMYKLLVECDKYFIPKIEGDASIDLRMASVEEVVYNSRSVMIMPNYVEFKRGIEDYQLKQCTLNGSVVQMKTGIIYNIRTGIALEIPPGYFGMLSLRSSFGRNGFIMTNSPGIIDSSFRGEIQVTVTLVTPNTCVNVPIWSRVAQLTIVPYVAANLLQSAVLSDTARGDGGFGSTGV